MVGTATKQDHNNAAWHGYLLLWGCSGNRRIHALMQTIDTKIHVLWVSPPARKIPSVVCTAIPKASFFNWLLLPSPHPNESIPNSTVLFFCILFYFQLPEKQVLYLCVLTSVSVSIRLEFPNAYLVRVCAAWEFPPPAAFTVFSLFCWLLVKGVGVAGTLKWQ